MRRLSPSTVIAALALFIALGGTGYAALKLPRNSVGAAQLRKNAVTSAKVKNGSLRAVDFARRQLPAGPRGNAGTPGRPGAPGRTGTTGRTGSRGRTGATGAKGATGLAGAAGTARAYGVVKADGTLVSAKSLNLSASRIAGQVGAYCVTPTAASGIEPASVQPVATADSSTLTGSPHVVQSVRAAETDDCTGGWEFITDDLGHRSRARTRRSA